MENEHYRVKVLKYVDEPRRVVVWRKGENGPWIIWGSMAIPDDVKKKALIKEVFSRLPAPVARSAVNRVELRLKQGMGQAT